MIVSSYFSYACSIAYFACCTIVTQAMVSIVAVWRTIALYKHLSSDSVVTTVVLVVVSSFGKILSARCSRVRVGS